MPTLTPAFTLTADDALAAAEIVRENEAGHHDTAEDLIIKADLGHLTDEQMRALCEVFGVEI